MGDLLERYVIDHREELDDLEPTSGLWERIDGEIKEKKTDWTFLWKVAAIIFLISTIYLSIDRQMVTPDDIELAQSKEDFFVAEKYYFQMISTQMSVLENMHIQEKNADLIREEDQLNQIYIKLKREYLEGHTNEKVKDALLENLQLRIKILNNQIEVLKEINSKDYDSEHSEI